MTTLEMAYLITSVLVVLGVYLFLSYTDYDKDYEEQWKEDRWGRLPAAVFFGFFWPIVAILGVVAGPFILFDAIVKQVHKYVQSTKEKKQ